MQISAVIPTYNRPKELNRCLDSIIVQTRPPAGVLVIDNGTGTDSKNLVEGRKKEFEKKGIILKYIKNERENSLTVAKNIGIKHSTREIISFLDDDLVLDKKYYEEITKTYERIPNALGVEGHNQSAEKNIMVKIIKAFNKLFYIDSMDDKKCKVFPSLGVTYPPSLDDVISCEWLSGASTYKKVILEEIKPDENLKKYSHNEDQDLSYRIFKKYPNSLFLTPHAKYWHEGAREGRIPTRELIYMAEVYDLYLFYKNMDQNLKNKLIYLWSRLGRIFKFALLLIFKYKSEITEIKRVIGAPFYCAKHINEIKRGDLEFFNKTLR